ncbi:tripartite tricarboxylate transporter substrate binding protein [Pigmentiphaga soli]|uniref:Tripartite tricarboxylate transporter substrate binding protein n=1 Tax=Pigmentiphaga soli TaxID=1007095 RepID=A0ABP8GKI1_9BURK
MYRSIQKAALGLALACSAAAALAAGYPERPVRTIVPYAPGGASDVVARVVTKDMEKSFGQPFVVDNRPGGGAIIGTGTVANAAPDGYTIGAMDSAFVINPALVPDRIPYDTQKDFAPVILLAKMPIILAVNPSVKANSLKELIALAKSKPGGLNYGSAGNGSPLHLAGEQFKYAAGIDVVHVPYKGGAPSIAALVAGETQMAMTVLSTCQSYVKSGRLKALAVTGSTRLPEMPDVPTFAELGYPSVDSFVSFGIVAPKGTPDNVVATLNDGFNRQLKDAQVQKQLNELGFQPIGGTAASYKEFVSAEIAKWIKFTKLANIKVD